MNDLSFGIYLQSYLAPLAAYLERPDITDIFVNRPGELWVETIGGGTERHEAPELTDLALARLARQVASHSAQGISREHPLLSASLPGGSRVQIALPPATRGDIAIAIRKHVASGMSLDEFAFFDGQCEQPSGPEQAAPATSGRRARALLNRREDAGNFLKTAVRQRKNILISGGTSSGKTTLLNALIQEVPQDERLILIEDAPELLLSHANSVGLIAARSALGEARIGIEDLLIASLRMRPDRIIMGELRGREVETFLRAINTGHPGSISTIHADSPERAIDQMALILMLAGSSMSWENIVEYIYRSISVIVQVERRSGKRYISSVVELSENID